MGPADVLGALAGALQGGPPQPPAPPPPPPKFFDVTVVTKRKYGCARVEAVPPEEFGISRRAKSVADADYAFHETTKSARELIAMGFDEEQVRGLPIGSDADSEEEAQARDTVEETDDTNGTGANWVTRRHSVTEHYAFLDYLGDGKARLYRVTTAGGQDDILERGGKPAVDEVEEMPFAAMTPIIMPHRFFGRSVADLVMDIQRIKTALLRELLDNTYLANNQRIEIAESHAGSDTIDDILNNRPGGVVRTKMPGGLNPIPNQSIGEFAYPMLEYMDGIREWRTGVTKQGQGIDAKALSDQSATAASQMFTMAQARMRLIARIFAETGIRDLFLLLHAVIRRNDRQSNTVKLRNEWVAVAPQSWQRRKDMTVSVGIGTGGKAEQMAFAMQVLGIQAQAMQTGSGLASPPKVYNTLSKIIELIGWKSPDAFFDDPASSQPKPPPPDPKMVEAEAKGKAKEAELQMTAQAKQAELAMEAQTAQAQAMLEREKMEREFALRREQMQAEFALSQQEMEAEFVLKRQLGMMNTMVKARQAENRPNMTNIRPGGKVG